ncbi:hypothetical protein ACFVTP_32835 [Streptomyces celluloflavus]|uniref:hypothetical protein n=1 Tax=Streptomyces celluloflavus TaxID=58344 RepID=UPI0036DA5325
MSHELPGPAPSTTAPAPLQVGDVEASAVADAVCALLDTAEPATWSPTATDDAIEALTLLTEALRSRGLWLTPRQQRALDRLTAGTAPPTAMAEEQGDGASRLVQKRRRRGLGPGWCGLS